MDDITFRIATTEDLPALVALLSDDILGRGREGGGGGVDPRYARALADIQADPHNDVIVAERAGRVVGCLQLTIIPTLARLGTRRAQIEGVRVAAQARGAGLGRRLFRWAIDRARDRGCGLVQLTSDKARSDAHRFYADLGFTASHEGYKLALSGD